MFSMDSKIMNSLKYEVNFTPPQSLNFTKAKHGYNLRVDFWSCYFSDK